MSKEHKLTVKVPEKLLPGVYANQMIIRHTREEFLIDFVNRFPPEGVVASRVIVSPGHLKRMIGALRDNLGRYESIHGQIVGRKAAPAGPATGPERAQPGAEETPGATSPPGAPARGAGRFRAKVPESVLAGVYANQMVVSHSPDEFVMDFVNIFPPEGVVTARVFMSPTQLKRTIRALQDNLERYESAHGSIVEANVPRPDSYLN